MIPPTRRCRRVAAPAAGPGSVGGDRQQCCEVEHPRDRRLCVRLPFPERARGSPEPVRSAAARRRGTFHLALARGPAASDGVHIDLRAGECALPFGTFSISFEPHAPRRARFDRTRFVPAAELYIERLQNRYRDTGIGAPLAADLIVIGDQRGFQIARKMKVPATTLLRLDASPAAVASGRFNCQFLLFAGNEDRTVAIAGEQVPLENEPSAAFAFAMSNPDIWQAELTGLFKGDLFENLPTQLAAVEPYRPSRIPGRVQGTARRRRIAGRTDREVRYAAAEGDKAGGRNADRQSRCHAARSG
jgi:hypothetical protein